MENNGEDTRIMIVVVVFVRIKIIYFKEQNANCMMIMIVSYE
jgi:hypothetical protein